GPLGTADKADLPQSSKIRLHFYHLYQVTFHLFQRNIVDFSRIAGGWESPEWVIFWGCVFCQMRR
ncbi:hypothetical protein ACUOA8_05835, partial [Escherichia sp. SS-MK2]